VTVRELVEAIRRVTGKPFPVETVARRPGDAAALLADSRRAAEVLGWRPTRDLEAILDSAWRWHAAG
jgi:UDP-glucose 4-epimerase